ncbi:MAG TPA: metallophosphoesterase [Thermoanaerobaculia bacterium]|nr:metallophosphoesterase [Thermoanaerobaculia bacterium]
MDRTRRAGLKARLLPRRRFLSPEPHQGSIVLRTGRFAAVGDLQRTSRAEVWRESNDRERERVLRAVAAEAPDFVALLGDLVFRGSSAAEWSRFDVLASPIRLARIPVVPVLGNHEYWVARGPALANYFARFPHLEGRRWHAVSYGPLRIVALDSNERFLTPPVWEEQRVWFEEELAQADADPAIRGVLVLVHHPPYTNSTVTRDELHVQRSFVPTFERSAKTLAMLSGHVHSYERFVRGGKTYVVTGGGGGPRVRLASESRRRHADDQFGGPSIRDFHYLVGTVTAAGVEIEMKGMPKGGESFTGLERFTLLWPEGRIR